MQICKYLNRVLFLGQTKQIYLVDLFVKKIRLYDMENTLKS